MRTFETMGLSQGLIDLLDKNGITQPTPIQQKSIGRIMAGGDLIGEAHTGTGKTLAFLLPMFENFEASIGHVQGLVVSPTRELAIQITDEAKKLQGFKPLKILAVYGGQDIRSQLHKLKGAPDLIIATPGRLIDHIKRETVDLTTINTLVLDEADQMLHIGFKNEVEFIIRQTNKSRQTLCFSATMNKDVKKLAYKHMKDPMHVSVKKEKVTLDNINQFVFHTTDREKFEHFVELIGEKEPFMAIVFCRTRRRADALEEKMAGKRLNVAKLHGGMSQSKREVVMKAFKATKIQYLIATDVAARGLDVTGVTHVFNYDMPENAETYVHRIGRTGRAGEKGISYLMVTQKDKNIFKDIERSIQKKIQVKKLESEVNRNRDHLFSGDHFTNPDGTLKEEYHRERSYKHKKGKSKGNSGQKSNTRGNKMGQKNMKSRKKKRR